MKKLISFLAFALILAFTNNLIAQTPSTDVVYLKNGSIIKGVITEINPNVNLKMKTSDGNIFVFEMKDVEKIIKEEIAENINNPIVNPPYLIKTTSTLYRDPTVSTLCSFLIPGIGQFYNGQSNKAVAHMIWYFGSYGIMYYSFSQMLTVDYYGDPVYVEGSRNWAFLGLIATFSGITSWICSMVDANKSSKAINRQLGFASFQLGKQTNLSFNPDIKFVNDYSKLNYRNISPSYGLNMRISF
ncbi:MAG: hypothetical protein WCS10_01355 [Bacteroidales bacterium]|jgi:TM2 domain-containing membrane protein YozV|nr:hypothetical protein [Bacteroidales bacterium]MDD4529621.1 hypothetical protein [Bacteroidales bacterium]MDD4829310.1 hypothetical protein [Bacteroidales bacterium]